MAKYYDIYTRIPDIKPFPQVWVIEDDPTDGLVNFRDGLMYVENIVWTTVKELSNTKRLACWQDYFMCIVESRYRSDDE